jgi:membrane fusion protein (multidrug efflux system)
MEFRPRKYPFRHSSCGLQIIPRSAGIARLGLAIAFSSLAITTGCNSSSHAAPSAVASATIPSVQIAKVSQREVNFAVSLPGELQPYEAVAVYPKVTGFVRSISVDRGSRVIEGQVLAQLEAPELVSQKSEAEAKLASVENQQTEAEAKLAKDQDSFRRLKVASATPGVISDNELEIAQKSAEADSARVVGLRDAVEAAKAEVHSAEVMESYLRILAPFTGIVTERNVHPGALVGPAGGGNAQVPMLRIEQISSLRLVVAVPEAYTAGVIPGAKVNFSVPAFPNRLFTGTVARVSNSLDTKTRTMPVELDVKNEDSSLAPGMFPSVSWPVRRRQSSLIVPQSALLRTMQGTYVIRVRNGITEWVGVKLGVSMGSDVEIFGELRPDDEVVLQASEELQPNTKVSVHLGGASGG